jgi:hypothetical protein
LKVRRRHEGTRPLVAVEAVALAHQLVSRPGLPGFLQLLRRPLQPHDQAGGNGTLRHSLVLKTHESALVILGVVEHMQATLGPDLEVGGLAEAQGGQNRTYFLNSSLVVQFQGLDPSPGILADQPASFEPVRQAELPGIGCLPSKDRAGNGVVETRAFFFSLRAVLRPFPFCLLFSLAAMARDSGLRPLSCTTNVLPSMMIVTASSVEETKPACITLPAELVQSYSFKLSSSPAYPMEKMPRRRHSSN